MEGSKLKKVYREGKELHFEFSNGNILGMHLMLHGSFNLFKGKNEKKNTIVEIHFDDTTGLALTDYQGAANITLNPVIKDSPDALSDKVDYNFLKEKLSKKKTTVKAFLLDQNMIRGIGNAYRIKFFGKQKSIPSLSAIKLLMTEQKLWQKISNQF